MGEKLTLGHPARRADRDTPAPPRVLSGRRSSLLPLVVAAALGWCASMDAAAPPVPAPAIRTNVPVPPLSSARSAPAGRATNVAGRTPAFPAPGGRAPVLTNPAASRKSAVVHPAGATNQVGAPARPGQTNAATKQGGDQASGSPTSEWLRKLTSYPVIAGAITLFLIVLLFVRMRGAKQGAAAGTGHSVKTSHRKVASCNVLHPVPEGTLLWQFDARGARFSAGRQHQARAGDALPRHVVEKSWGTLFQRKLNVAWLPPGNVFLRVIQLPQSDFAELVSMVEFQLEKLSPIPVTQIVWSLQVLPGTHDGMQTVVVMIVARNVVEEFLTKLEGEGYLADRLDLPLLDQLLATAVTEDGAWVYPDASGQHTSALVAWWYGGVLRNLDLIALPEDNRAQSIREQLLQMSWAGELEGWMTSPPVWHLVADPSPGAVWEPVLREALDQAIQVFAPVPPPQLAGLTATRVSRAEGQGNLLPPEFATRYQQQFVDRLWMRALLAIGAVYGLGVLIYFVALGVAGFRTTAIEEEVAGLGTSYTNAMQLKARYQVLKDRQELKFAALDVWNTTARMMPESITLDSMNFNDGKRVTFTGSAPASEVSKLIEFEAAMRKAAVNGQPLFSSKGDNVSYHANPAAGTVNWNFSLELNRVEVQ